ncbi:MAG: hypothetical protein WCK86_06350 [Planctomycetia bacterium]
MILCSTQRHCAQVLLLATAFVIAAYLYFGSWSAIRSMISGAGYVIEPDRSYFKRTANGTTQLNVTNHRRDSSTILGMSSDCRCVSVGNLPITIPAGEERSLVLTFTAPGAGEEVTLHFYVESLPGFAHVVQIE